MKPNRFPMPAVAGSDSLGLQAHLIECDASRGRWFALRCAGESFHNFIAPRCVTTAIVLASVAAAITLVL